MGLWRRIFGKKNRPDLRDKSGADKFSCLPEIAGILTNRSRPAQRDIGLLAKGSESFLAAHRKWCQGLNCGLAQMEAGEFCLLAFAYWLCGYPSAEDPAENPGTQFGAYIDWKEEPEDIIRQLETAAKNLGYKDLALNQTALAKDLPADEALDAIGSSLAEKGYFLVSLDTGGDCYHLFVIIYLDYKRLLTLAQEAGFRFIRHLQASGQP